MTPLNRSLCITSLAGLTMTGAWRGQAEPVSPPACCAVSGLREQAVLAAAVASPPDAIPPEATAAEAQPPAPDGMVWVEGGTFTMGSELEGSWPSESPTHAVRVDGFWMDETEVTNRQFAAFVEATDYVTVAERPLDWEELKKQVPPGTPKPADDVLQPGAVVFHQPDQPVSLDNMAAWWRWTPGASWQHPQGPASSIEGLEDHPVVQIAWEDARAYAAWAGKSLPTEAQWEYAARGGLDRARFGWGDTFRPQGKTMANTWDGTFPHHNTLDDGHLLTAPVKSFPPNAYGLYDLAGNVWEWTADLYRDDRHALLAEQGVVTNPAGPAAASDAANPRIATRVVKGGSFLCHADYCESYRPAARRGLDPATGLQHTGFRCVLNAEHPHRPDADPEHAPEN